MSQAKLGWDLMVSQASRNPKKKRSWTVPQVTFNAQAAKRAANCKKFNLLHKKEENIAKRLKKLRWQKPFCLRKQLQTQEKNNWKKEQKNYIRRSKKSQKSWTVSQGTDGGSVQVGPPEMPGMHQPSTFSRKVKICSSLCQVYISECMAKKTGTKHFCCSVVLNTNRRAQINPTDSTASSTYSAARFC